MPRPSRIDTLTTTLHYRLSHRHMPYYLDEFTFRFNRRNSKARGRLFYRLLQQAVDTDPHPVKQLVRGCYRTCTQAEMRDKVFDSSGHLGNAQVCERQFELGYLAHRAGRVLRNGGADAARLLAGARHCVMAVVGHRRCRPPGGPVDH